MGCSWLASSCLVCCLAATTHTQAQPAELPNETPHRPAGNQDHATSGKPEGISLSLDEALSRAEAASPLVKQAIAETRRVRARDIGASLLFPDNPQVYGYLGPRRERDPAGGDSRSGPQFGLQLGQEFEVGGQRSARQALVAQAVKTAKTRELLARIETRVRVKFAYVASLIARAQTEALLRREELAGQLFDAVQTRVDHGAASNIDLRLAEVEQGQAQRERLEAEQAAVMALAPLRMLINAPVGERIWLGAKVDKPSMPGAPLEQFLALARDHRVELQTLAASGLEVDAELEVLRREAIPNPSVSIMFQRDLPGQEFFGGAISIPVPVFRQRQGERAVARAERERLRVATTLTERAIALEVEAAYHSVALLAQRMDVIENKILPAAEASVDLLREGWRAGKFDFFRVIQASREAWEARRVFFRTLGELWQATLELERATGRV